ncbi:C-X-C motif chemokine 10-like [Boleophthalmus pectinirostris]|uniref:C-X-C motif chemokine 10-like n=1 Tax=Boleophthalmus pectinirostris TaxID=150288 RepID=UPI000A1C33FB|nr:C-X-C motif chemokine 10-like [Boleophthalmus pectinirostris]
MSPVFTVVLVLLLTASQVIVQGDQALNLRCRCIQKESKRIGRYLRKVEVHPANSHCKETEIVATLKKNGQKICLDPSAKWVKRILSRNQKSKSFKSLNKG